ncbi:MAG: CRISPR-associated protein Cas5e family [Bacteroidota bacterium]|nr:CRISPR-associated protein Cas5e family [Bacteroidota bacterium]
MKKYLIFYLYGPIVSWGDTAIGSVRPSHRYPTKSAIMGLIAAAVGYERKEEEKLYSLQGDIGFAVRIDGEGTLMIDYHTTQVPSKKDLKNMPHVTRHDELNVPKLNTVLSTREYYCDALYTIALWECDETKHSLEMIKQALNKPKFVLYAGRKSCPLGLPIKATLILADSLEQALLNFDKDETALSQKSLLWHLKKSEKPCLYSEEKMGGSQHTQVRKDRLVSRKRWQYSDRNEYYKILNVSEENKNVP